LQNVYDYFDYFFLTTTLNELIEIEKEKIS